MSDFPPTSAEPNVVGRRLRRLLHVAAVLAVLTLANSAYLAGAHVVGWLNSPSSAETPHEDRFYLWMLLGHVGLGLLLAGPLLAFAIVHLLGARRHTNRLAVRLGYALLASVVIAIISGVLLLRLSPQGFDRLGSREVVYWAHVAAPCLAVWLFLVHRLSGPPLRWKSGAAYGGLLAVCLLATAGAHVGATSSGRSGSVAASVDFHPSLAKTASGGLIDADILMMDDYCKKCHPDIYKGWFHSAHRFSSFNNPMYLASVRETRQAALKRDGSVAAARWCAGCHDPVTLLSGAFDDPEFDDVGHATAHAGITCTVCHAITEVNSPRGNADYTIAAPEHYPFTGSGNPVLQSINEHLVKAKPSFHKRMFLKPLHKTAEFCSTCHKVHLPHELNHYRQFLRGQNHYDSFLVSGVSGHGARSAYFPMRAARNCAKCHMPLQPSDDFGARRYPQVAGLSELSIHDHLFPGGNAALPWLQGKDEFVARQQEFLRGVARVDLFAIREGGTIDGKLHAPVRENIRLKQAHREQHADLFERMKREVRLPVLKPGEKYLLDVVVRNQKTGHHFTQGTADSNQVWVEVIARSGGRVIGCSGGMDEENLVDPWSHFVNAYVLDRDGNRIERRNPQDIFTTLYNHQIGPGSAQVAHYSLQLPEALSDLVTVDVRLLYRKFDSRYMQFVTNSSKPGDPPIRGHDRAQKYQNSLPVSVLATDRVIFPVKGVSRQPPFQEYAISVDHLNQRWKDYCLALATEGSSTIAAEEVGMELKQAADVYSRLARRKGDRGRPLHRAKLFLQEGRLDEAAAELKLAKGVVRPQFFTEPVYAPWAISWTSGLIERQQGNLDGAIRDLTATLEFTSETIREHGYDFSRDYVVLNELGRTLIERAKLERGSDRASDRRALLRQAVDEFHRTLAIDPENAQAHYGLATAYSLLGERDEAGRHRRLHRRYKPDDNARDRARRLARLRDPAANHAAERIVIYPLNRPGAPGLEMALETGREEAPLVKSGAAP